MHACGHGGHTASLLAAAHHLASSTRIDVTAYLIFQAAEEGGAGVKAMIDDGPFRRFAIDEIYGFHNWPRLPRSVTAPRSRFSNSGMPISASLPNHRCSKHKCPRLSSPFSHKNQCGRWHRRDFGNLHH